MVGSTGLGLMRWYLTNNAETSQSIHQPEVLLKNDRNALTNVGNKRDTTPTLPFVQKILKSKKEEWFYFGHVPARQYARLEPSTPRHTVSPDSICKVQNPSTSRQILAFGLHINDRTDDDGIRAEMDPQQTNMDLLCMFHRSNSAAGTEVLLKVSWSSTEVRMGKHRACKLQSGQSTRRNSPRHFIKHYTCRN